MKIIGQDGPAVSVNMFVPEYLSTSVNEYWAAGDTISEKDMKKKEQFINVWKRWHRKLREFVGTVNVLRQ